MPYRLFSVQIAESDFLSRGAETLTEVGRALTPQMRRRMRELLAHFRKDIVWQLPGGRVAENIMLDAVRWAGADSGSVRRRCCLFGDALNAKEQNSFYPTVPCTANISAQSCPGDINVTLSREELLGPAPC